MTYWRIDSINRVVKVCHDHSMHVPAHTFLYWPHTTRPLYSSTFLNHSLPLLPVLAPSHFLHPLKDSDVPFWNHKTLTHFTINSISSFLNPTSPTQATFPKHDENALNKNQGMKTLECASPCIPIRNGSVTSALFSLHNNHKNVGHNQN